MKKTFLTAVSAAILLAGVSGTGLAQSSAELNVRMTQMEDQLRQLMGQVEDLNFQVGRLQAQLGTANKSGDARPAQQAAPRKKQQLATQDDIQGSALPPPEGGQQPSQGVEEIQENSASEQTMTIIDEDGNKVQRAPGPKILGTLPGTSYESGQVLVPPGQGDTSGGRVLVPPAQGNGSGGQVVMPSGSNTADLPQDGAGTSGNELVPDSVETVSLGNAATDNPELLYERSYESLLRRQFSDAEVGFRAFLDKHRDHSLAGNAQYWLGETYYVQGEYKQAAQTFLGGYREFPKSRKAADSLLKLGLSLGRLGQRQQACAAYSQVGDQFPKATEAKKRAQAESKRAGC
ncbi:tol-pal system protein YbgF [soil metagenome]